MKSQLRTAGAVSLAVAVTIFSIIRCVPSGTSSSTPTPSPSTTPTATPTSSASPDPTPNQLGTNRSVDANTSVAQTITTNYGGQCKLLNRDTSSCQSARTALGFSGNWLKFSCNVTLGLLTSGGATATSFASASYVTVSFAALPDYTSNYWPTSGTYSFIANSNTVTGNYTTMYSAYTTSFPDPSYIAQQSSVMKVPIVPTAGQTSTAGYGAVGVSINGIGINDSLAGGTDSIFSEEGSFDQCQGHPNGQNGGTYHYHSEPYSISYNDNNLIGIMMDGYWIYGRKDFDGSSPAVTGNVYTYGGHVGSSPLDGAGSTFHYHVTLWSACLDEQMGAGGSKTYYSDDGSATCTHTGPGGVLTGTTVNAYFLTGHGNGGVFRTVPSGPSNNTPGVRYFYGVPGTCTGC